MAIITLGTFSYFPMGFIEYPVGWTFGVERNRTVLDVLPSTDTMVLLVESIYNAVNGTVIPFVTFFTVVLCTILLSLSLQKSKAWRKKNKNTSSKVIDTPDKDSKLKLKHSNEIRAVKMMITIATVFIVTNMQF